MITLPIDYINIRGDISFGEVVDVTLEPKQSSINRRQPSFFASLVIGGRK